MDEPGTEAGALQIESQRPVEVGVAVAANDLHGRADGAQALEERRFADVAEMPDFIGGGDLCADFLRQVVVRVGEDGDAHGLVSSEVAQRPALRVPA